MINRSTTKAIALLSGGLDSTTLAYDLKEQYDLTHLLSFDYGQRHKKELHVASRMAHRLGVPHDIVRLGVTATAGVEAMAPLAAILKGSALTDDTVPVPDGHYAAESMKQTVVPNRNAIMLSIAYGVAVAEGADLVAFAAHAGDHAIYPDCRPEFVYMLSSALQEGNQWASPRSTIIGPYLDMSKADIAVRAHELGVPIEETWSCYKGGDIHCGTCGTCYERREALTDAFSRTGIPDPTTYLDTTTTFPDPVAFDAQGTLKE